ncbi:carboxylesterase NlhH [Rhodococcus sp. Br-6]|nr:alpha/beta hydrolase fold domain-containing protein [Prescottella equi]GBF13939.1 carboxylesterase NlhH [Rhodococcus sp. Br-6]MBM4476870.1 alpha/beta hydrolase fold domain-containing protein [Prescottella equi]MBM4478813.1 alpha/beta hydrolase fold domain-containing protein [Prescottella equi]NKR96188.1 alpha/beta hydrolase fold domain-containing protein [Prescottella equi]
MPFRDTREPALIDRIHPELRPLIPALPRVDITEPVAFRSRQRIRATELAAAVDRPEGMAVVDRLVPGPAGAPDVPVRLYTPGGVSSEVGALVWFHGGGYVFGEIEASERACVEIADVVGCVVVSVEYRLAPEHPYPAGLDDCSAALTWVAEHGDELGVDPSRLAIGGVSAGAGLAAALALRARDEKGPRLVYQVLDNPMLDDRVETASIREFTDTPLWTYRQAVLGWEFYLGDWSADTPSYAAAARAADVSGLPPAWISANEVDPLRDEAIEYALRLMRAGVPVELHHRPGTFHGSNGFPGISVSDRTREDMHLGLKSALAVPD